MLASKFILMSMMSDDWRGEASGALFLFLAVLMVSVFSFVSIAVWSESRRKEREAYYKAESLRRVAEIPGDGARFVIEMMREEERIQKDRERTQDVKKREGMKVGGLVTIAVGVGMMVFMANVSGDHSAYLVGLLPGLIGVALLFSALFILPKPPAA
jgi:hypothetical protein